MVELSNLEANNINMIQIQKKKTYQHYWIQVRTTNNVNLSQV